MHLFIAPCTLPFTGFWIHRMSVFLAILILATTNCRSTLQYFLFSLSPNTIVILFSVCRGAIYVHKLLYACICTYTHTHTPTHITPCTVTFSFIVQTLRLILGLSTPLPQCMRHAFRADESFQYGYGKLFAVALCCVLSTVLACCR